LAETATIQMTTTAAESAQTFWMVFNNELSIINNSIKDLSDKSVEIPPGGIEK